MPDDGTKVLDSPALTRAITPIGWIAMGAVTSVLLRLATSESFSLLCAVQTISGTVCTRRASKTLIEVSYPLHQANGVAMAYQTRLRPARTKQTRQGSL
jgi:hypothetical protein